MPPRARPSRSRAPVARPRVNGPDARATVRRTTPRDAARRRSGGLACALAAWWAWTTTGVPRARDDGTTPAGWPSRAFCARADPMVCAHGVVVDGGGWANGRATAAAAKSAGATCVEVDVARTKDGALVAMHGRDVARFTRGAIGDVGEVSRDELEMWNEDEYEALDLRAALAGVAGRGLKQITIDYKENAPLGRRGLAEAVVRTARSVGCSECLYWGKDDATLRETRALGENVGYVVANFSAEMRYKGYDKIGRGRVRGARAVAVQSEMLSSTLVRRARRAGLAVHVWTVNDEERMRRTLNHGVDGILTDRPMVLRDLIASLRARCTNH